jgi:hypothetical protein
MKGALLQEDLDTWKPLVEWLERRSFSLVPIDDAPAGGTEQAVSMADSLTASG